VTAVFGIGALASSFYAAFTLPNLFRRLLGEGALTAAFVPALSDEMKARGRAGAFQLLNTVASWLFVSSGAIVVVSMAAILVAAQFTGRAESLGISAKTAERWHEAADLAVILFPYLLFVSLAAAFSAALQTLNRFLEPALSPIWLNVAMIVMLGGAVFGHWAPTRAEQMLWLCGGALVGGFLQMAVPALALIREGWKPRFSLAVSAPLRQIGRLMVPTLFGSAIYLINMAVSRFLGLSLNESAVAVLNLANRLMELPIGVFTVAVSTVIFPLISRHASAGDWSAMAQSYRKGMRLILVINVPAAIGLMVLATPIIRLLFQHGDFDAADTAQMRPVLIVCAVALPFISFVSIVLRAFYAQKDTTTPVRAAVISFVVNLVLSLALMRPLGTVGLALASNLAVVVQAIYLQMRLARTREGLNFQPLRADLVKVLAAALVMGAVVAAGWRYWRTTYPATDFFDVLGMLLMICLGIVLYVALVWLLRIEGREDVAAVLAKARSRLGLAP
jgi:putative peptidoglycan lipid II flippase